MSMSQEERQPDDDGFKVREYVQQIWRESVRESWLTDEQMTRMNCLSLAVSCKPFALKDEDTAATVIEIAGRFAAWVQGGDDTDG